MIRWNSFGRSALFAAVAAAAWLPWAMVVGPLLGMGTARALYWMAVVTIYIAGLSAQPARGLIVAFGAALAGLGVIILAGTGSALIVGLAGVLAVARSLFLYRASPARAVVTEAVLLITALWFARWLGGFTLLATSIAVWAFLIVQSCFFVIAGVRAGPPIAPAVDAFDEAYQRAAALLDGNGV